MKLRLVWRTLSILLLVGVLAACNRAAPIPTATPLPAPALSPNANLYPLAGQWHGGKIAHPAVYDRASGRVTFKYGNFDNGYIEVAQFPAGLLPVAGDWDGDTQTSLGLYDPSKKQFLLWNANTPTPAQTIDFPNAADDAWPLAGDWDGSGKTEIGLYEPRTSRYLLCGTTGEVSFSFGKPGLVPLAGDWDGDGKWTIGQFEPSTFTFSIRNQNSAGDADQVETLRAEGSGWLPLVGDWDGSGCTRFGLFESGTPQFYIQERVTTTRTVTFQFGEASPDVRPVVGDWNGDGIDTVGLYNRKTTQFFLRNENSTGAADLTFTYGIANKPWLPVAGDWNADGKDSVGFWDTPNFFHLRNANTTGGTDFETSCAYEVENPAPLAGRWMGKPGLGIYWPAKSVFLLCEDYHKPDAKYQFPFGQPGLNWLPLAGDWDGDGKWGIGLYEPELSRFHLSDQIAPAEEKYTFVFGKANSGAIPLTGDWTGTGRTDVGLYNPATSYFSLRVPVSEPNRLTHFKLYPPAPLNANLRYFGFYSGDGFDYTVPTSYIPEIAALGYTNVVHIHPQFEDYEIPHFKAALADARAAQLQTIVNVQWIFVRQKKNEKAVQKPNWREEFERFTPLLQANQDLITAFYFDEPIELGITADHFRDYTQALHAAFPDKRIIVVESASQILNGNLTADYLQYASDIGIDLYYTDPTYLGSAADFQQTFADMSAQFQDKAVWLAVDGYTRRGSSPRDLVDAADLYYSLGRSHPRVAGMLVFVYSPGNPNFTTPARSLIQPGQPTYSAPLAALYQTIGRAIVSGDAHAVAK
jgi:hypothetical protein